MLHFLVSILQLLISPGRGWEDIQKESPDPAKLVMGGFIPLLIVTALTVFIQGFYTDNTFVGLLCDGIVIFIQYFITYFLAPIVFGIVLVGRTTTPLQESPMQILSLYGISVMAVITIIENCVPMELSIIKFLPVYAGIVLWKGAPLMNIKAKDMGVYIVTAILTLIVFPLLIGYLLSLAI